MKESEIVVGGVYEGKGFLTPEVQREVLKIRSSGTAKDNPVVQYAWMKGIGISHTLLSDFASWAQRRVE